MSVLRRVGRWALIVLAVLVLAVAAGVAYLFLFLPKTAAPKALQVARTPAQLERGEYLVHHVVGCTDCHGKRDWTKYSAPQMHQYDGQGGISFPLPGVGTLHAPNITPTAIGNWSDGELLRAMTEGVTKDGRPLFPLMPYMNYRQLSQDDAEAVIAYIRTLPPSSNQPPRSELQFPMNLIVRTIPSPATLPQSKPNPSDKVAYGKYLVTIASCGDCHTKMENGQQVPGMMLAGGMEFRPESGGVEYSANITPDVETGIGSWTESDFVGRFKQFGDLAESDLALNGRQNTEMLWRDFGGMTREDLAAIYAYLRTVPPVRNAVPH